MDGKEYEIASEYDDSTGDSLLQVNEIELIDGLKIVKYKK